MKFFKALFLFITIFSVNSSFAQFRETKLNEKNIASIENSTKEDEILKKYKGISTKGEVVDATRITDGQVTVEGVTRMYESKRGVSYLSVFVQKNNKTGERLITSFLEEDSREGKTYLVRKGQVVVQKSSWLGDLIDCVRNNNGQISNNCGLCAQKMAYCKNKKRFRKFWCIIKAAFSSPCRNCVGSVWQLIQCVIEAFN